LELAIRVEGPRVRTFVNGVEAGVFDGEGRVGLNVDACRARFRVR
jgi:hypothetical protein